LEGIVRESEENVQVITVAEEVRKRVYDLVAERDTNRHEETFVTDDVYESMLSNICSMVNSPLKQQIVEKEKEIAEADSSLLSMFPAEHVHFYVALFGLDNIFPEVCVPNEAIFAPLTNLLSLRVQKCLYEVSLANEVVDVLNRVLQGRLGLSRSSTAGKFDFFNCLCVCLCRLDSYFAKR